MSWSRADLAHLYRRAGFGGRPDEIDAAVATGYGAAVERLLDRSRPDPATAAIGPTVVGVDPKVALGRAFPWLAFV